MDIFRPKLRARRFAMPATSRQQQDFLPLCIFLVRLASRLVFQANYYSDFEIFCPNPSCTASSATAAIAVVRGWKAWRAGGVSDGGKICAELTHNVSLQIFLIFALSMGVRVELRV
jgi:hypothetical protein